MQSQLVWMVRGEFRDVVPPDLHHLLLFTWPLIFSTITQPYNDLNAYMFMLVIQRGDTEKHHFLKGGF